MVSEVIIFNAEQGVGVRGTIALATTIGLTAGGFQAPQFWMRRNRGRGHSRWKRGL